MKIAINLSPFVRSDRILRNRGRALRNRLAPKPRGGLALLAALVSEIRSSIVGSFLASKFQRRLELFDWLTMQPDLDPINGTESSLLRKKHRDITRYIARLHDG